jgi:hypothetical protein
VRRRLLCAIAQPKSFTPPVRCPLTIDALKVSLAPTNDGFVGAMRFEGMPLQQPLSRACHDERASRVASGAVTPRRRLAGHFSRDSGGVGPFVPLGLARRLAAT